MRNLHKELTRVTVRAEHLSTNCPSMLSSQELQALDFNPLQIAKEQERRGLLGYIKVC